MKMRFDSLMSHGLGNYVLPGLESHLLNATPRLLINTREQLHGVAPHSHRYDLYCLVLSGIVKNTLWYKDEAGDEFCATNLSYLGAPGSYKHRMIGNDRYLADTSEYTEGDWYAMHSDDIHSISFSRDAVVLVLEGESKTTESILLEPISNGKCINMDVAPWMFTKLEGK